MELLNALENEDIVKKAISDIGYSAEHNYYHYIYNCYPDETPLFFKFEGFQGILCYHNPKNSKYRIFGGILTDPDKRLDCLMAFLEHITAMGAKKIEIETDAELRGQIIKLFKDTKKYAARKITTVYSWPLFRMCDWDGDKMQGKDWKDMRYYWNKYFREHKVEFKKAGDIKNSLLRDLVLKWKKQRTNKEITHYDQYLKAINNDFQGFNTRIMVVDGNVVALTAGFKVPNRNYYYSAIGIYSRDIERTGEICNMDDLMELKKQGYEYVDFGGGEEELTQFKKKFRPDHYYKTYVFNIVPNT